ncbi:MAG: class I SAM-dependent methyltransferase [Bryobacteraceae bacterium]|nr:class I SAM-dependent methyltransferase [Bryobacteraceae bacterium]
MQVRPLLLAAAAALVVQAPSAAQVGDYSKSLAPYVPTPHEVVRTMLDAAALKADETVYDLGSGDGRVLIMAAKDFKAKAVGVELSPKLVEDARERIRQSGLANRCRVIQGDLREVDLSDADVVVLYLLTSSNELLRPNLEKHLKAGARVVSHDFEMRGWKPARVVQAPAHGRTHRIYVYEMPASR